MLVRALAIVGIALLTGLIDSYFRPIVVSLEGSYSDPTRTDAWRETEKLVVTPLTKEEENDPRSAIIKRGGSFITLAEAKQLFDLGVQFFDARVQEEFAEGHIKGAVLVDPTDDKIVATKSKPESLNKFDPRFPVVVYCNGGECDSSQLVAIQLKKFGFVNVKVFEGGITEWQKARFPVEKSTN
jgi:rhodanese-related sulfurtransferase